tara:strand:- start:4271 stop:5947 length:1677 start_codon:yes stop_codon:yes gene_type:complete
MKQKVGLLVDSLQVSKQIKDFIDLSLTSNNYEISTIIVNNSSILSEVPRKKIFKYIQRKGFSKFINKVFFIILNKLEKKIISKKLIYKNFYNIYKLPESDFEVIKVSPIISKSGLSYTYDDSDLEKIKRANLQLLVRGGRGILRGKILTCCPNGIISFHHADNDVNRGGPAGFWEVYKKQPRTGFIIQRLNEELDGGDVLYKGFIRTSWFYSLNKAKLYEISNPFLHKTIDEITSNSPNLKIYPKTPYVKKLYTVPNIIQILNYLLKTASIYLHKKVSRFFGRRIRWSVAYQFTNFWLKPELGSSIKIQNPKNRFLADPFLIYRNGKHYCFVEDFDYSKDQGCISVYEIRKEGYTKLGKALVEDFHLAYPYLFEFKGELYMCPDTHAKNDIRLYKCVEFPLKWEFEKTLINNISAVDTSIFFHEDRWWLISNMDYSPVGEHYSQLHVFHNSSPIGEDWIAHKSNPAIFDPLKARNGGFIIDKSKLYRVYQRQGFNLYGRAFGVAEIKSLSTEAYTEESLFEVEPDFFPNLIGTHTYNYSEGLLVFDYANNSNKKSGAI